MTPRENNLINLVDTHHITAEDAIILQMIAHRLHSLDENACNYGLTPQQEKRVTRLEAQAQTIANEYHLNAYHQGDPRGWSLYLVDNEHTNQSGYDNGIVICPH